MVALPIFSCLKIEPVLLPSMLLSSHTMFDHPHIVDLSEHLHPILYHFESIGLLFDALYIGYIGNKNAFPFVHALLRSPVVKNAKIYVDPIMADHGRLYRGMGEEHIQFYRQLLPYADAAFPNKTEAELICGKKENDVMLIDALLDMGVKNPLLKSIEKNGKIGVMLKNKEEILAEKSEHSFPGTGDIFASLVIAGDMLGRGIASSAKKAVNLLSLMIAEQQAVQDRRFGLCLERYLGKIMEII